MCGIYFSCTKQKGTHHFDNSLEFLRRRGPDSFKYVHTEVNGKTSDTSCNKELCVFYLTFIATVLSLRGDCIVEQPLKDEHSGSILCWNGEAWKINGASLYGNDAVAVLDLLVKAISAHSNSSNKDISSSEEASQAASDLLSTISGPSAFVFYDSQHQRIFYGRDALGRRSLLQRIDGSGTLMLSSVFDFSEAEDWSEVEPGFIHSFEIGSKAVSYQSAFEVPGPRKTDKTTLNDHSRCQTNISWPEKLPFSVQPPLTNLFFFLC